MLNGSFTLEICGPDTSAAQGDAILQDDFCLARAGRTSRDYLCPLFRRPEEGVFEPYSFGGTR